MLYIKKSPEDVLAEIWLEVNDLRTSGNLPIWMAIERLVQLVHEYGVYDELVQQLEGLNGKLIECPYCKKWLIATKEKKTPCTNCDKTIVALW